MLAVMASAGWATQRRAPAGRISDVPQLLQQVTGMADMPGELRRSGFPRDSW
jgi:hypothetical protein